MTRILLIRHGETWANREKIFAGYTDAKLTDVGYEQARRTAKYVISHYDVDVVYASDLQRAFETGKEIADNLGIEVIPEIGLREIFGGAWENVAYEALVNLYPKEYVELWMRDIGKSRCVGGESVVEMGQRVMETITKIALENEEKTVVVATHATPIRAVQCLIEYENCERMAEIPWVSNASVSEIEYCDGKWKCIAMGLDEHLGELCTVLPSTV